jgi:hypothetical protein
VGFSAPAIEEPQPVTRCESRQPAIPGTKIIPTVPAQATTAAYTPSSPPNPSRLPAPPAFVLRVLICAMHRLGIKPAFRLHVFRIFFPATSTYRLLLSKLRALHVFRYPPPFWCFRVLLPWLNFLPNNQSPQTGAPALASPRIVRQPAIAVGRVPCTHYAFIRRRARWEVRLGELARE